MQLKTIIKNINLLNISLLLIVIVFAIYILFPMLDLEAKYALPPAKKTIDGEEELPVENQIPSITEYTIVSEENLFHPERRIPVEKKEEQPLPKPEFVLYGTLITDDMRIAYMEDLKAPRNTPGRGKRQTAMRKGDALSGFALKEIETDKVVMLRGEEKIVIPVSNPSRQKDRQASPVTPATPKQPQGTAVTPPPQRELRRGSDFRGTIRPNPSIQQPATQRFKPLSKKVEPHELQKR